MYECPWCFKKVTRPYSLKCHMNSSCKKKPKEEKKEGEEEEKKKKEEERKKKEEEKKKKEEERKKKEEEENKKKEEEEQKAEPPDPKQRKLTEFFECEPMLIESSQPELDAEIARRHKEMDKQKEQKEAEHKMSREQAVKNKEKRKKKDQPAQCPHCKKIQQYSRNIARHIRESCPVVKKALAPVADTPPQQPASYEGGVTDQISYTCNDCEKRFTRLASLKKHKLYSCKVNRIIRDPRQPQLRRGQQNPLLEHDVFQSESAFHQYLRTYQLMNKEKHSVTSEFLESKRATLCRLLMRDTVNYTAVKFSLDLEVILQAPDGDVSDWTIKNESIIFLVAEDADEVISEQFRNIQHRVEEEMIRGSGWQIVEIMNLILKTNKYEPLRGSSYLPLPDFVAYKKAVVNPKNLNDEMCFKYAILASQHDGPHAEKIENIQQYEDRFDWSGLEYPVSVHDVKIFEKNNKDVSISVYAIDEDNIIAPIKFSMPKETHIDLLLITEYKEEKEKVKGQDGDAQNTEEEDVKPDRHHYTYIKKFEKLFSTQISKYNGRKHICKRCLTHHSTEQRLIDHQEYCKKTPLARILMPKSKFYTNTDGVEVEVKPTVKFNNPAHSCAVPVRVYADSEALLMKVEGPSNNPSTSNSNIKQHHIPMSFGYIVNSELPSSVLEDISLEPKVIRGVENPTYEFLNDLVDISKKLKKVYEKNEPMKVLTAEELHAFENASVCYMCDLSFTLENDKVRDHCHISGQYRGPAHNNCNVNAKNPTFLPVYLHNNSSYDAHFIIKQLGDIDCNIKVIPNTSEKMITFSIIPKDGIEIRFLDSFRFMATSLENLANNLAPNMFNNVEKHFGSEHMDLLRRKGVFCYDYVDHLSKLEEPQLPPRSEFYSKLYECETSEADYNHALTMFQTFQCRNLGDYSDLYLKLDVLLLADVFEAFRQVCFMTYNLDPCWYFTCPGLAWDAALRYTKQELDLIQDEEMLLMIERGIRGGVAQCIKRYARARNGEIDPKDKAFLDFLMYLDANNLYGLAQSLFLPEGNFNWDNSGRLTTKEEIMKLKANDKEGFFLEVDVRYPETLHDVHKDLPFLPETRTPPEGKHPKLLTTLFDKKKYVVHYMLLQQSLKHGLELVKVHRVISFKQSDWLKKYIALNTNERKKAKNAFEKDFYKLMNNAVFGKTMEQVRNRINLELVNNIKRLRKLIRSPFFKSRIIYDENLCAVLSHKKTVLMNKPIYVGMAILDLSKHIMYEFHYEVMVPRYGAALSLCYMDTDSYIYFIQGIDVYAEMGKHLDDFDTSDYPKSHPLFSEKNMKVLGKFKDEANSKPVEVFVGLKAKMYAIKYGGKVMKRAKGVKRHALGKKIGIRDYIRCLKESTIERVSFRMITCKDHVLFTKEVNKISLSSVDDKRFIMPNLVDTLPHGHRDIIQYMEMMAENQGCVVNTDHIVQEPEES